MKNSSLLSSLLLIAVLIGSTTISAAIVIDEDFTTDTTANWTFIQESTGSAGAQGYLPLRWARGQPLDFGIPMPEFS